MIRRFLRHPLPYLVLLVGFAYWNADSNGWLEPRTTNDTQGYEHLLKSTTVSEALSGLRTFGYPFVIRVFGLERDAWASVPRFHFALYGLAILFFWQAVSLFTRSRWLAFAAAAPLCVASVLPHIQLVVTDSIAESLGLISVSLLLLLAAGRSRILVATLLGMSVFLVHWIRPIYAFLVVLVPLLGAALRLCYEPRRRVAIGRWTLGLAALTFVPLLTLSAVRWRTVGEFRPSSFTGYHIGGGIGAMMLDDELVAELPEDMQRLAREILEERKRRGFKPMRLNSWSGAYQARQYGFTIFNIVEQIVTDIVLEEEGRVLQDDLSTDLGPLDLPGMMGPTALKIDHRLHEFGRAAIRKRPLIYVKWIVDGLRLSVSKALDDGWLQVLLSLLALSIPVLLLRAARDPSLFERPWSDRALGVLGLALAGTIYFLGHSAIVALVHWPKDRYATAAILLLPPVLSAGLFELWRFILPPGGTRRRRPSVAGRVVQVVLALLVCTLMAETFFSVVGFDFDRQKSHLAQVPIFYRQPRVPTGSVFFRRAGPDTWNGPVLARGGEVEIRYDATGFRNPPNLTDWEIVVVGDGFVESGYLSEDKTFTAVLGRQSGLRVKNLGASFAGPLTYNHYLETWGKAASTRHAVFVFNEGDDLKDLSREAGQLTRFQTYGRREYRRVTPQTSLLQGLYDPLARLAAGVPRETVATPRPNADLRLPDRGSARRVRIFQRVPGPRSLPKAKIEHLDHVMNLWAESARALGLEPWVLYLPCKHRIWHPYLSYDDDVAEPIRIWRPNRLPELVKTIADARGIRFLDPIPRLHKVTAGGSAVYNPVDIHLSQGGSRELGRFLAKRLGAARNEALLRRSTAHGLEGEPGPSPSDPSSR